MTTQITVRLPDELVAFIDELVAVGSVKSRADAVARAVARERRRQAELADVEILQRDPSPDPDLDGLARHVGSNPVDLGD